MKIACRCGHDIPDQTDTLPQKAYLIPDQEWFGVLEAIDEAVDRAGAGEDAAKARRAAREVLWRVARSAWQCRECGRLYLDDREHDAWEFVPAADDAPREILRSRPE